jgi:outer membrane lipoprotein-sorting protein
MSQSVAMISFPLRLLVVVSLVTSAIAARAEEPAIIPQARALLAPDTVLDAVRTVHYVGSMTVTSSAEPGKSLEQQVEIFLEKPARQRIVVTSADTIEINALDGYEAWRRTIDAKDSAKWQQSQLSAEQIKQLRADVWENLAFFRGIEREGGRVEDQGPATIDGIECRKIAFFHRSAAEPYFRFFNAKTGKLVMTGTPENNIHEEGELVAGGIRFPKTIIIAQTAGGQTLTRRLTFNKITVNETFPASLFAVPLPTVK